MNTTTMLAIYFLIWWLTLFAVLPWGIRSQTESGDVVPGSDPGAPTLTKLLVKIVWTTAIASVLFGALYTAYVRDLIPYEFLSRISSPPPHPTRD
jgi:predicted secreted protein